MTPEQFKNVTSAELAAEIDRQHAHVAGRKAHAGAQAALLLAHAAAFQGRIKQWQETDAFDSEGIERDLIGLAKGVDDLAEFFCVVAAKRSKDSAV